MIKGTAAGPSGRNGKTDDTTDSADPADFADFADSADSADRAATPSTIALASRVRAVFDEIDPVPEHVLYAAIGSYSWRTVDTELARLVADTAATTGSTGRTPMLASVRGTTQHARLVTFEAPDLTVEVEVGQTGAKRRLIGQLVPPGPGTVQVLSPTETQTVNADVLGRFIAENVPAGPVSLTVTREGATRVVTTTWISI